MGARAPIHGPTLAWARTALGLSAQDLAHELHTNVQQIEQWESQTSAPTVVQLRALAKKLGRTPASFFAPPPADSGIPATPDFRGRGEDHLPAPLLKEIKRAESYRQTFLELSEGRPPIPQIRPFQFQEVAERAAELRQLFLVGTDELPRNSSANEALSHWRGALEDIGFLVFQTTGIDVGTFRGLSIRHDVAPVIILNGADSAYGKVFTLFHEVGHIINGSGAVCLMLDDNRTEELCNAFAAEFLMPARDVRRFLRSTAVTDAVDAISREFKVSQLAAAVRLKVLGVIDHDALENVRRVSDENWSANRRRQREGPGFVPHWQLRYRDLGPHYVGAVIHALETDRIDALDASYMLDTRIPTLAKLQEEFHRRTDA